MNHRALVRCVVVTIALPALGCVPTPPSADPGSPPPPVPAAPAPVTSPPALTGGTLLILRDGNTAVAADPDRDAVFVVDLVSERLLATAALQPGDEPGRLVGNGADDTVFVALRRGGAVVSLNPRDGKIGKRQPVCAAPRGIAFDTAGAL
jgi:hypothetical protein